MKRSEYEERLNLWESEKELLQKVNFRLATCQDLRHIAADIERLEEPQISFDGWSYSCVFNRMLKEDKEFKQLFCEALRSLAKNIENDLFEEE